MSETNTSKGYTDWAMQIRGIRNPEVWARVMKGKPGHMMSLPTRPEAFEKVDTF